ncbi:thermonuclease family protein [Teichococcus aestuarii]|uniref:thermonuclease family protein n=1 Tax=Teichococcus aestuarii TaxID=568898 RepID=UPI00360B3F1F
MSLLVRLLLGVVLLSSQPVRAVELLGQVVGISDGDTLTLLTPERQQVRVRLHGIDAPESRQPYGTRAQQELSTLAFRRLCGSWWRIPTAMAAPWGGCGPARSTSTPS